MKNLTYFILKKKIIKSNWTIKNDNTKRKIIKEKYEMKMVSLLRYQYKNKHSSPSFYFATRTAIRASNSTILDS